jgi:hypothetical protein
MVPPALSSVISLVCLYYIWSLDRRMIRFQMELSIVKEELKDVHNRQFAARAPGIAFR